MSDIVQRQFEKFAEVKTHFDLFFQAYEIRMSTYSCIFKTEAPKLKVILTDKRLSARCLGTIQHLRKKVFERMPYLDLVESPTLLPLFSFRKKESANGYEYDLKEAYARQLFEMKAIEKESFEKLQRLTKPERHVAIGSLGSKITIIKIFETETLSRELFSQPTIPVWDTIVFKVNTRMRYTCEALDAHFFWFDAVFLNECVRLGDDWKEKRVRWEYKEGKYLMNDGRFFTTSVERKSHALHQ